ncbi:hypothetical protein [Paenibacillus gallinarum]|uniref:Uncharacterized protein n=1 Tax=Paenibacillus gallinarum TaxID=2762232 RepID=A0ABR8T133_9BACL|nr:hypothetical protein [Paenibacillus gallinarum]MBD7969474.1 hypothetical protein [Paenibacillus gallinarum]
MSDEMNKEILEELKRINEKLDNLNIRKGLSTPFAIMAIVFGFSFVGPLILILIGVFF